MPSRVQMPFSDRTKSKEKNLLISNICSVFNTSAFLERPLVFTCWVSVSVQPIKLLDSCYRLTHVLLANLKVRQSGDKMEKRCTQQDFLEPLIVTYRSNWNGGEQSSLGTDKISSVGVFFHLWLGVLCAGEGGWWVSGCVCGFRPAEC